MVYAAIVAADEGFPTVMQVDVTTQLPGSASMSSPLYQIDASNNNQMAQVPKQVKVFSNPDMLGTSSIRKTSVQKADGI